MGDEPGHGGISILIKEKWSESVLSISRVNPHIMMLKMLIEKFLVNIIYVYASQVGFSNHDKVAFYEQLLKCISSVVDSEIHVIVGDFNGHVGKESITFDACHSGKGYGTRRAEDIRPVQCDRSAVSNTCFDKNQNKFNKMTTNQRLLTSWLRDHF